MATIRLCLAALPRKAVAAALPSLVLLLLLMAGQTTLAAETPASRSHRLRVQTAEDRLEPMPQVQVSLLQVTDGVSREVAEQMSNDKGHADFEVGHGTYQLRATLEGFLPVVVGPFTLDDEYQMVGNILMVLPFGPLHDSVVCSF